MAQNKEARELIQNCDGGPEANYDGEDSWLIQWDQIKWYQGYEAIDQINDFVEALANSDDMVDYGCPSDDQTDWNEHFKFVRLGEEYGDIRCDGEGFWDIYPQTSIHIGA